MRPRFTAVSGVGSGYGPAPLSRLRRPLVALCVLEVVTATAALIVAAVSPAHTRTVEDGSAPSGSGSGPGAPTVSAVQAMLDRHGADVIKRNRKGFLADVDKSAPAARYRAAQAASFDNLAGVPLASWSYHVSAPVTAGSVIAQAAARYRAPTLIVRVDLSYQLRNADPAPSTHDLWLTVVQRSGHVRIAGDADLAGEGGASWHGPWDFGPVVVRRGESSLLLIHPDDVALARVLNETADSAVAAVSAVWGAGWPRRVVLILPDSHDEMRAVVGTVESGDVAAQTVADQDDPSTGLRVVLNPAELPHLSTVGLRIVLRHEITHVATWSMSSDSMPTWLIEGFADYVANLHSGQPVPVAAAELHTEVRAGKLPAGLPTGADFTSGPVPEAQVYEEAWLACRLIASLAGQAGLVRFYRQVARSTQAPQAAIDAALRDVVGLSTTQFTARWRRYLQAELR